MKKRTNKQFNQIVALFLVFVSVCAIVTLKYFDNSDNILDNYFECNSSTQTNQFKAMISRQQDGFIAVSYVKLLKYKDVNCASENASSTLEVDFPSMNNSEEEGYARMQKNTETRRVNLTDNEATYSIHQSKTSQKNASSIQFASNSTDVYSSSKTVLANNIGNQLEGHTVGKNQSNSNNVSNAFSSNNTLSLTTDLSENISPMLIDGGSNPGDPGIPVGDGTWILLIMMLIYSLKKRFITHSNINI